MARYGRSIRPWADELIKRMISENETFQIIDHKDEKVVVKIVDVDFPDEVIRAVVTIELPQERSE